MQARLAALEAKMKGGEVTWQRKPIIYGYLIVAYGVLVKGGRYALSPEDNPKKLKIVSELYREKVAEWLVEHPAG